MVYEKNISALFWYQHLNKFGKSQEKTGQAPFEDEFYRYEIWDYAFKGTSHDSIFKFSLFSTLADVFAV